MSRKIRNCEKCEHEFPVACDRCPHCDFPNTVPNVYLAGLDSEISALNERYKQALDEAKTRRAKGKVEAFESAVSRDSVAVINRPFDEAFRLAMIDTQLYSTYYKQIESGQRMPDADNWDLYRRLADDVLFSGFRDQIRFASLSLSRDGLGSYGDCAMVLNSEFIASRASVFEENTVIFLKKLDSSFSDLASIPEGCRATWTDRGKLAVAKLSSAVQRSTNGQDFPLILLKAGEDTGSDEFIEVHVYGSFSIKSLVEVRLTRRTESVAKRRRLQERLERLGIQYSENQPATQKAS